MAKDQVFMLRMSESERDLLKSLADHMSCSESEALRVCLATVANETNMSPSDDLRALVRKILQPVEVG